MMPLTFRHKQLHRIKDEIILQLKEDGMTLSEIGYIFGITKQAVSLAVRRAKKIRSNKQIQSVTTT